MDGGGRNIPQTRGDTNERLVPADGEAASSRQIARRSGFPNPSSNRAELASPTDGSSRPTLTQPRLGCGSDPLKGWR